MLKQHPEGARGMWVRAHLSESYRLCQGLLTSLGTACSSHQLFKFIFSSDRSTNSLVPKVSLYFRKRLEVKLEATSLKAWVLGLASGVQRHLGFSGVPRAWAE